MARANKYIDRAVRSAMHGIAAPSAMKAPSTLVDEKTLDELAARLESRYASQEDMSRHLGMLVAMSTQISSMQGEIDNLVEELNSLSTEEKHASVEVLRSVVSNPFHDPERLAAGVRHNPKGVPVVRPIMVEGVQVLRLVFRTTVQGGDELNLVKCERCVVEDDVRTDLIPIDFTQAGLAILDIPKPSAAERLIWSYADQEIIGRGLLVDYVCHQDFQTCTPVVCDRSGKPTLALTAEVGVPIRLARFRSQGATQFLHIFKMNADGGHTEHDAPPQIISGEWTFTLTEPGRYFVCFSRSPASWSVSPTSGSAVDCVLQAPSSCAT